ncbi:MAG: M20/M25/M40 family metallo-hydrolase, partial [Geothrix sp.]
MNTLLRAACLGLLTFTLEIHGQVAPPVAPPRALEKDPAFQGEAYRLMREIEARSQAYAHLEELCDGIGGRPTGSEALDRAQAWVKTKLRAFGITHVKEEPFTVPSGWVRGEAKARLLTANGLDLRVAQIGWTPATPGSLRAEVVIVGGKTVDALKESLVKARSKIALRGELPPPPAGADKAAFQRDLRALWDQAGLLAILFPMSRTGNTLQAIGTPVRPSSQWTPAVPSAYLGKEHANLLRRLLARGQQVSLALELGGRLLPEPFQSRNLIVEIPGSERPQECVIVGAHLDSVDLATGATDNGAGVAALLELLRAVHASGLRPVRTLRVIFFSGEELESLGSRAYVDAHRTELANIQAVLVMDKGAGRIIGWPTMGQE